MGVEREPMRKGLLLVGLALSLASLAPPASAGPVEPPGLTGSDPLVDDVGNLLEDLQREGATVYGVIPGFTHDDDSLAFEVPVPDAPSPPSMPLPTIPVLGFPNVLPQDPLVPSPPQPSLPDAPEAPEVDPELPGLPTLPPVHLPNGTGQGNNTTAMFGGFEGGPEAVSPSALPVAHAGTGGDESGASGGAAPTEDASDPWSTGPSRVGHAAGVPAGTSDAAPPSAISHDLVTFVAAAPLLAAPVWALYRRILRARALDHPQRRQLLEAIQASPGLTVGELRAKAGLHYTTVLHHVRLLEEVGLVQRQRVGGQWHCFPHAIGATERNRTVAARSPTSEAVLRVVAANPGIRASDAARAVGIAPSSMKHHIDRLESWGLLKVTRDAGRVRLHVDGGAA